MGYVTTTYAELVKLFGEPNNGSADGKTTCEWRIEFDEGLVATIYDWKTNSVPRDLYKWHIGGHSQRSVKLIEDITNMKTEIWKF